MFQGNYAPWLARCVADIEMGRISIQMDVGQPHIGQFPKLQPSLQENLDDGPIPGNPTRVAVTHS